MKESGWTYQDYVTQRNNEKNGQSASFITQCRNIIEKLKKNTNSWPFLKPVDRKEVPDYYAKIKEPMDLETLEKGLESGNYKTKVAFVNNLKKIFTNAKTYNKQGSIYYKNAVTLESFVEQDIKDLKES